MYLLKLFLFPKTADKRNNGVNILYDIYTVLVPIIPFRVTSERPTPWLCTRPSHQLIKVAMVVSC